MRKYLLFSIVAVMALGVALWQRSEAPQPIARAQAPAENPVVAPVEAPAKAPPVFAWQQTSVALSEVFPMPKEAAAPTWVEVVNFGTEVTTIAGWQLFDKTGCRFTFPETLPAVPGGGVVLVTFSGPKSPADDLDFADGVARLYAREAQAATAFRGPDNECALVTADLANTDSLVDYIAWGGGREQAFPRRAMANEARLAVSRGPIINTEMIAGGVILMDGSSIGRTLLARPEYNEARQRVKRDATWTWDVYVAFEISPGQRNVFPAPGGICDPRKGGHYMPEDLRFTMNWGCTSVMNLPDEERARWKIHLQVARDEAMTRPFIDKVVEIPYVPETPFTPGKYYSRARGECGAEHTAWSPAIYFTVKEKMPE